MSYDSKIVDLTMALNKDRFVTPTFIIPPSVLGENLSIPLLNDDAAVILQRAAYSHRFNYPMYTKDYESDDIILEFDFDDADGTTITDNVSGIVLTEGGDPAFQQSAAVAGLGNGIAFDGTGDVFTALTSLLPQGWLGASQKGFFPTTGDFAVELVFNLTNGSNASKSLMALRDGAIGVGWSIETDANEHLDVYIEDADQQVVMNTTTDISTGSIVYLGIDFDRDGNCTAYVNGAAVSTAASIAAAEKTIWPGTGAACRLVIGGDGAGANLITGTMYFARVYNKILGATRWLEHYRILSGGLVGAGYPGWNPVIAPRTGADLQICDSAADPADYPVSGNLLNSLKNVPLRIVCAVEQTTSPTALPFKLEHS